MKKSIVCPFKAIFQRLLREHLIVKAYCSVADDYFILFYYYIFMASFFIQNKTII